MDMVASAQYPDRSGRAKRSGSPRILTHFVAGFIIQESNFSFTADDDDDDELQLPMNGSPDYNGDVDMELCVEDSHSSNDDIPNDVFTEDSPFGNCEQCGCVIEVQHHRGPRRFCSTSCARRYSVSCSRKMMAYHARMKGHGHTPSESHIPTHRKASYSTQTTYENSEPSTVDASIQVNEFDTVHPMNFDWTRCDVEPLWLYEHVAAAKWTIKEVSDFIRALDGCEEYADSFMNQEIDGQALMLLREEHMVVAMKMKLGPALKIVAKVNRMKCDALKEHQ